MSLLPDPGEGLAPESNHVPLAEHGGWLDTVTGALDVVPGWAWAIGLTGLLVVALITLPIARRLAYRAGRRASGHSSDADNRNRAFLFAAVAPAALLWIAVLIGSARGLIAFGRDDLRWSGGWEALVPFTLDGVGISFGFLAFLAIRNNRNPDRSARLAGVAMLAGAGINFLHEAGLPGGSWLGGAYLALMSTFGLLIFHELLAQFEDGAGTIRRTNPKFGMRWLTWPSNTLCAWIAWRNYPPKPLDGSPTDAQKMWWGSINHAVVHLTTVRRAKRVARYAADLTDARTAAPWWSHLAPWVRVRQLDVALSARQTEMAEMSDRLARVAADFEAEKRRAESNAETARRTLAEKLAAEEKAAAALRTAEKVRAETAEQIGRLRLTSGQQITAVQTERDERASRLDRLERQWIEARQEAARLGQQLTSAMAETDAQRLSAERAEKAADALRTAISDAAEKHRIELAETIAELRAENAENVARIRAESGTVNLSEYRDGEARKARTARRGASPSKRGAAPNQPVMSDEDAVQELLRAHPEADWQWSQPQIRDITGAGGERLKRLQIAIAEHHRNASPENGRGALTGEAGNATRSAAENGSGRRAESTSGERSGDLSDDDKEDSTVARPFASATA